MEGDLRLTFVSDLPLTVSALQFAAERHAGQQRSGDEAAFVIHPLEVAFLVKRAGLSDHVIAAAVLHDVLEDTSAQAGDLRERFGERVAGLVDVVSDDPEITDEEERKRDLTDRVASSGIEEAFVYAADKISKVRELRTAISTGADDAEVEVKVQRHWRSLLMLEDRHGDCSLNEVLRFELEALALLPPSTAS